LRERYGLENRLEKMLTSWAPNIVAAIFPLLLLPGDSRADPLLRAKLESVGVSSQKLAQISVALNREIGNKTMPGAVVAIAAESDGHGFDAYAREATDEAGTVLRRIKIKPIHRVAS
jgi:hypothetical protein